MKTETRKRLIALCLAATVIFCLPAGAEEPVPAEEAAPVAAEEAALVTEETVPAEPVPAEKTISRPASRTASLCRLLFIIKHAPLLKIPS